MRKKPIFAKKYISFVEDVYIQLTVSSDEFETYCTLHESKTISHCHCL